MWGSVIAQNTEKVASRENNRRIISMIMNNLGQIPVWSPLEGKAEKWYLVKAMHLTSLT